MRSAGAWAIAVLAGFGLLGAAEVNAAVRVDRDKDAELRFELDGHSLTVALFDRPTYFKHPSTLSRLSGQRVRIGCGTTFRVRSWKEQSVVWHRVRWPRGADTMTVRFSRDISRRAKWCLIEEDGGPYGGADIAFVSFHDAEPGRRLTTGVFPDGTPWRLAAWRGEKLEPCLSLRVGAVTSSPCYEDLAEVDAGIQASFSAPPCIEATVVFGATARSTARVEARAGDGSVEVAELRQRPRGSRVRAQYFFAVFDERIDIDSVTAYDANGRVEARDGSLNGSRPDCPS